MNQGAMLHVLLTLVTVFLVLITLVGGVTYLTVGLF